MPIRVLVVEDDVDLREILLLALKEEGYAPVGAENGLDALVSLAFAAPPDAVLLNLHMPVLSGSDVMDALRGDPALEALPVILMTGAPVPPDVTRAVDAVLVKPFEIEVLTAAIDELVSRRAPPLSSPTPPPCAPGL